MIVDSSTLGLTPLDIISHLNEISCTHYFIGARINHSTSNVHQVIKPTRLCCFN